ncbi:uncharacterized protein HHUB_4202 (plasmid) [Halobacterium hubeiense]|uniref:Uncharacterized protein n=1 Tax=Halobacterium hubeiense TaxID=1407499 RepID=A0A0U5H7M8_9EURY|nr:uncharacterized protein HHUB_4202 [Halobacterium hubeiense]
MVVLGFRDENVRLRSDAPGSAGADETGHLYHT